MTDMEEESTVCIIGSFLVVGMVAILTIVANKAIGNQ
jgi:hypothetical protein